MEEIDPGYEFFPVDYHDAPGCPRFDVTMRPDPPGRHFAPQSVRVSVVENKKAHIHTIHHPWLGEPEYEVTPGRIVVRDKQREEIEAYTFGAQVKIISTGEKTTCTFTSPAPILDLVSDDSAATLLADEVEIMLAGYRARRDVDLEARLPLIDPNQFYAACLIELREKFTRMPHLTEPAHQQPEQWLHREAGHRQNLGLWPEVVKTLDDLVGI